MYRRLPKWDEDLADALKGLFVGAVIVQWSQYHTPTHTLT
jgi:hypothetical protein